jgi:hypothetical protein
MRRKLTETSFRGQEGAYHVDCHDCAADVHVVAWSESDRSDEPTCCPFCGSEDIWQADESLR